MFSVIKCWKNIQSFQTLFLYIEKIQTRKTYASNIWNCLSGWKWVGYLTQGAIWGVPTLLTLQAHSFDHEKPICPQLP